MMVARDGQHWTTLVADVSQANLNVGELLLSTAVGLLAGALLGFWYGWRKYRRQVLVAARHAKEAADWHRACQKADAAAKSAVEQLRQTEDLLHAVERDRSKIFYAGRKIYLERIDLRESLQKRQDEYQQLAATHGQDREQLEAHAKSIRQIQRRMRAALKLEGQLWNARALQGRPKFRPLERRQSAVVSILNLKGGVGKTTVTAHLGRALAVRGYRVLLIDMDLQGSLTSMMLTQEKTRQAADDEHLLQHFLQKAAEDPKTRLRDYAFEVYKHPDGGSLDIVGTSDSLAYAELNLTMRWLVGSGTRDTRFLLRKALHLRSVSQKYDIVLIDCPPLVNISCVNALAASDYVVIPTTMTRKSRERVPPTLRRILRNEKFLKYVNNELRVLGVLANRTHRGESWTQEELGNWNEMAQWCRDAAGQEVRLLTTRIPETREMREFEGAFGMPEAGSRVADVFAALTEEIEEALPRECRRTAKSSS